MLVTVKGQRVKKKMLKKAKGIESDIGLLKRIFSYVPN